MKEITEKTVDVESILRGKMGAKFKYVPGFLVHWLKRIVHQDEVNRYLWESRHLVGTEWLEECVRYLDMTLELEGLENLPAKDDGFREQPSPRRCRRCGARQHHRPALRQ